MKSYHVKVEWRHLNAKYSGSPWSHPVALAIGEAMGDEAGRWGIGVSRGRAILDINRYVDLPEDAKRASLAISNSSEWYVRWFVRPFEFTLEIPDPWYVRLWTAAHKRFAVATAGKDQSTHA